MGLDNHGIVVAGKPYASLIKAVAAKYRLPEVLISHQMHHESGFQPAIVSSAGAVGLMQLMPATATVIGQRHNLPTVPLEDPTVNANLGAAYMRELLNVAFRFTDDPKTAYSAALVGYYAGPARIEKVIKDPATMTAAEKSYVNNVIWDYEKTESWDQVYPWKPGETAPAAKAKFPLWLLLIPLGLIFLRR